MNNIQLRGKCKACGRRTRHRVDNEWLCIFCDMSLEKKLNENDEEILKQIKKSKLTRMEIRSLLNTNRKSVSSSKKYKVGKTKIRFGLISDTHIGNKYYDSRLMDFAAKTFTKEKVDFVIHGGDICEGHYENKRQGSIFELEHIGGDAQVERAVKELKKIKQKIYAITGNHETNTFFKMSGFDVGKQIANRIKNFEYIGQARGVIDLPFNKKIEILHPDGGSSYAISYRSQKIAESLEGGTKPEILLIGHYHKAEYLFYRNIHIFQNGCFESQTEFMRNRHLSAHKGFWIIDLNISKDGISKITPQFFPAYD